jgi:hypothetical protein
MRRLAVVTVLCAALAAPALAEGHTLTYAHTKAAVQARANALAGKPVEVNTVMRTGIPRRGHAAHAYYAQARWSYVDPTGCKGCAVAPDGVTIIDGPITRLCSAEFSGALPLEHVTKRSGVRAKSELLLIRGPSGG